jgi:hypothetical protein
MRLRDKVEPWLRKIMFPQRNHRLASEPDSGLTSIVNAHDPGASRLTLADAELELETRAWLRDFWTRSIVAWLALFISIVSIVIAICAFSRGG